MIIKISTKTSINTILNMYLLLNRNLGIDVKSWQLRKSKATYFPSKVEQVVKFLEGDEKMMMIRDENGDDPCL
jgi:hypothetical protein